MGVEREIRFLVTEGEPPAGGRRLVQAYLLRGPTSARVRLVEGGVARFTLKRPRFEGRFEWEWDLPTSLVRALLRLPLPRVEKTRRVDGDLEIDRYLWPFGLVVVECELSEGGGPDLCDPGAREAWMEARRPPWVRAWRDVTDEPGFSAARLARRRPRERRGGR